MSEELKLTEAKRIYEACKKFVETYEFAEQCSNRKGMYTFLEGIQMDLKYDLDNIIREIGLNGCPFKKEGE